MRKHHSSLVTWIMRYGDRMERLTAASWRWDLSRGCDNPRRVSYEGRPSEGQLKWVGITPGKAHTLFLDILTQCRRCEVCQRLSARQWQARAIVELERSGRTWFGTLTMQPERHYVASVRAQAAAEKRGWKWAEIDDQQKFRLQHDQWSREITLMFKRLRKNTGVPFRYLCTVEKHKSGLPHYHVLLHETWENARITKRALEAEWKFGFTKWRVLDTSEDGRKQARYVAKYISKAPECRVRASVGYGEAVIALPSLPRPNAIGKNEDDAAPEDFFFAVKTVLGKNPFPELSSIPSDLTE